MSDTRAEIFEELEPEPRLLMGPGPVDVYPRVLRAMSVPLQGQFDPQFTGYMTQTMALYRQVFKTRNEQTLMIDGTARAGLEACMHSVIAPGDKVLVPIFGRFGHLLTEIAKRARAEVIPMECEWGKVFEPGQIADAVAKHKPRMVAMCQGDTSATVLHPVDEAGEACRRHGAILFVDVTASLAGNPFETDGWKVDIVAAGLQKCLSGPPGIAPITFNERVVEILNHRRHVEAGIKPPDLVEGNGPIIQSNYFDLGMIMDYWSEKRLNHHTEATTMLYGARECARIMLQEGLAARYARHSAAGRAMAAGLGALGLTLFGDERHRMTSVTAAFIPDEVDGETVRRRLREDFEIEIGTAFGPLAGKVWRFGAMGYNARKHKVLITLGALEAVLRAEGFACPPGEAVASALAAWDAV